MLELKQKQIDALETAIKGGNLRGAIEVLRSDEYRADRVADAKALLAKLTKDGKLSRAKVTGAFLALAEKFAEIEAAGFAARRELLMRIEGLERRLAELEGPR